jgi:hypothetical protein
MRRRLRGVGLERAHQDVGVEDATPIDASARSGDPGIDVGCFGFS